MPLGDRVRWRNARRMLELRRRAADGPVPEAVFEECIGVDFAELRDRLSDYCPKP